MTDGAVRAARKAALCFAVARSTQHAGEREAAIARGLALCDGAALDPATCGFEPAPRAGTELADALAALEQAARDRVARTFRFFRLEAEAQLRERYRALGWDVRVCAASDLLWTFGVASYRGANGSMLVIDDDEAFELDQATFLQYVTDIADGRAEGPWRTAEPAEMAHG